MSHVIDHVIPHELSGLKPYLKPTDYHSVRFGLLRTLGVPICIVQDCAIQLNTPSLCVYVALLYVYKSMSKEARHAYPDATVTIRQGAPTNPKRNPRGKITI
jgi:hypothetical protein